MSGIGPSPLESGVPAPKKGTVHVSVENEKGFNKTLSEVLIDFIRLFPSGEALLNDALAKGDIEIKLHNIIDEACIDWNAGLRLIRIPCTIPLDYFHLSIVTLLKDAKQINDFREHERTLAIKMLDQILFEMCNAANPLCDTSKPGVISFATPEEFAFDRVPRELPTSLRHYQILKEGQGLGIPFVRTPSSDNLQEYLLHSISQESPIYGKAKTHFNAYINHYLVEYREIENIALQLEKLSPLVVLTQTFLSNLSNQDVLNINNCLRDFIGTFQKYLTEAKFIPEKPEDTQEPPVIINEPEKFLQEPLVLKFRLRQVITKFERVFSIPLCIDGMHDNLCHKFKFPLREKQMLMAFYSLQRIYCEYHKRFPFPKDPIVDTYQAELTASEDRIQLIKKELSAVPNNPVLYSYKGPMAGHSQYKVDSRNTPSAAMNTELKEELLEQTVDSVMCATI